MSLLRQELKREMRILERARSQAKNAEERIRRIIEKVLALHEGTPEPEPEAIDVDELSLERARRALRRAGVPTK
jgi:hypothetical protein